MHVWYASSHALLVSFSLHSSMASRHFGMAAVIVRYIRLLMGIPEYGEFVAVDELY